MPLSVRELVDETPTPSVESIRRRQERANERHRAEIDFIGLVADLAGAVERLESTIRSRFPTVEELESEVRS